MPAPLQVTPGTWGLQSSLQQARGVRRPVKDPGHGGDGEQEGSFVFCFLFADYVEFGSSAPSRGTSCLRRAGRSRPAPLGPHLAPSAEVLTFVGARTLWTVASLDTEVPYCLGPEPFKATPVCEEQVLVPRAQLRCFRMRLHLRVIGVTCSEGRDEAVSNWDKGRNLARVPRGCVLGPGRDRLLYGRGDRGAERCPRPRPPSPRSRGAGASPPALQAHSPAVWQWLHVAYAINPFLHYRALTDCARGTRSPEQPRRYVQFLLLFTVFVQFLAEL